MIEVVVFLVMIIIVRYIAPVGHEADYPTLSAVCWIAGRLALTRRGK